MSKVNRSRLRRAVTKELRRVRSYRAALKKQTKVSERERVRMETWIRIADETLDALQEEPNGKSKAAFLDDMYGLTHRPSGDGKYVYTRSTDLYHMSWPGLERWRENGVFIASVLAIRYGMIDLSSEI